ncbi:aminotransferase class IV family protein [Actinoallomurus bryophytorum]|uniref:aminotransferase class IV family protein n=1 Tax=Actinoallomurus bryophytorum TaxID=1490222 RepID=UPI00114E82F0|nr:aminotransferase class IV family protein [Actinoallomurus bryophytorum]
MTALPRFEIDGHAATTSELSVLAMLNYGHFTAMQVRGGRTRGLDLHLARLDAANRELYGAGLPGELVRDRIRHALGEISDAAVRVIVFGESPSVMVVVRPPIAGPDTALGLRTVSYQRPLAHVKHLGGFGQSYHRRLAEREGFDEALLTDPDGVISEGAITNLGCFDGTSVIWPDAPALDGITMLLLEKALPAQGVPSRRGPVLVADLGKFRGVFVTNSRGVAAVERVDDLRLGVDEAFMKTVTQAYESVTWDVI